MAQKNIKYIILSVFFIFLYENTIIALEFNLKSRGIDVVIDALNNSRSSNIKYQLNDNTLILEQNSDLGISIASIEIKSPFILQNYEKIIIIQKTPGMKFQFLFDNGFSIQGIINTDKDLEMFSYHGDTAIEKTGYLDIGGNFDLINTDPLGNIYNDGFIRFKGSGELFAKGNIYNIQNNLVVQSHMKKIQ